MNSVLYQKEYYTKEEYYIFRMKYFTCHISCLSVSLSPLSIFSSSIFLSFLICVCLSLSLFVSRLFYCFFISLCLCMCIYIISVFLVLSLSIYAISPLDFFYTNERNFSIQKLYGHDSIILIITIVHSYA